jgi:hypothetical protein
MAFKISVRKVREDIRSMIASEEKEKNITEDDKYSLQEELDKMVKEYNEKIAWKMEPDVSKSIKQIPAVRLLVPNCSWLQKDHAAAKNRAPCATKSATGFSIPNRKYRGYKKKLMPGSRSR